MKKIYLNILCIIMLGAGIASCSKDLGDYDYAEIRYPAIDTTGVPTSYTVEQFTNLVIDPSVNYSGNMSNLRYKWLFYYNASASNDAQPSEVVSTEKKLDVEIGVAAGNYIAELVVTDTCTGITDNICFDVIVQSSVDLGWLILYAVDGGCDVDYIVTPNAVPSASATKWLKNIYSNSVGAPIPGEGRFISRIKKSYNKVNDWVTVATSTAISRMTSGTFELMLQNEELFRSGISTLNPQADQIIGSSGTYEALINNGVLHVFSFPGFIEDALFSSAFNGDYYLAPFFVYAPYYSYGVIVYDQKYRKFVYTSSTITNYSFVQFKEPLSGQPFDLRNIAMDMLFMDKGYSNYTYAVFKNSSTNEYWLYTIDFTKADDGSLGTGKYDMSGIVDIANAKFFQSGELGHVFYYATDSKIYSYDYYGTNTSIVAYSFSSAETITSLKIYKPRPSSSLASVNGTILYVATWDGSIGRLYEFSINVTSGAINPTPLNIFEGFGKIADMCARPN